MLNPACIIDMATNLWIDLGLASDSNKYHERHKGNETIQSSLVRHFISYFSQHQLFECNLN